MWILSGLVNKLFLGYILGLEESEMRGGLAWSEMMVEWGLIEGLSRDNLVSGHGSR